MIEFQWPICDKVEDSDLGRFGTFFSGNDQDEKLSEINPKGCGGGGAKVPTGYR